jgi:hypothetical protein
MGQITTTLVISFADPAQAAAKDYHLSAEIDSRTDGFNKGVTSFLIGDSPVYLLYKSPQVSISQMTTAGSVSLMSSGVMIKMVETITFAKTREASISKPASGSVTWLKVGGDSGNFTVSGTKVTTTVPILSVYQATYYASADAYKLSGVSAVPGVPNVSVIVFIEGTTPD